MLDTKLHDEPARLSALHALEVLDTPPEAAYDRITGLVRAVLDVPMAAVSLVDSDRQWFKSCVGIESTETSREVSFCTHTIQARVPMCIPDAQLDPRFANNTLVTGPPFIRSYLGVPLSTPDGYNLGSLCAIDVRPRVFTAAQIEVLKSFAEIVMDEMELRRIAHVDPLTGALTRRAFRQEAEKAISVHRRHHRPATLLVLDVDHFKRVNDTYGHAAGDLVLQSVPAVLTKILRPADCLGRLGGEEFGIVLSEADIHKATFVAERLRLAIEMAQVDHDPPLRVTASFGVAVLGPDCLSYDAWLARADLGLYAAKRGGRNQCCAV
jgi:diguanylate cyclase (GGDEF)-like protein